MSIRSRFTRQRGFSMIELMIAILIGSLVLLGITSLFSTTSSVNRLEGGLARLQENGRFALNTITKDIRMATATRSMRKFGAGAIDRVTPDQPIISHVDFGIPARRQHGLPGAFGASGQYAITQAFLLRGYDCGAVNCFPTALPVPDGQGGDSYGGIPNMGVVDASRARGADVLTMRYLRNQGHAMALGTKLEAGEPLQLDPAGPGLVIGPSRLVVIGDAQSTSIIAVNETGGPHHTLTLDTGSNGNLIGAVFQSYSTAGDARVSDFDADFVTVTYHLRLNTDPSQPARLNSSLIRRESGQVQEIAQGIERLDFLYQVEGRFGGVQVMTAAQVNAMLPASCPEAPYLAGQPASLTALDLSFCGWRAVRAIEVHLLANTIDNVGSSQEPYQYAFLNDGSLNATGIIEVACDGACTAANGVSTLISQLPAGRMLRREFRSTAAIRNNAF